MLCLTDADDAKMLLDIAVQINYVIINQLAFSLVDICLDNTLQILRKSLLCLAKLGKLDYSKSSKFGL